MQLSLEFTVIAIQVVFNYLIGFWGALCQRNEIIRLENFILQFIPIARLKSWQTNVVGQILLSGYFRKTFLEFLRLLNSAFGKLKALFNKNGDCLFKVSTLYVIQS